MLERPSSNAREALLAGFAQLALSHRYNEISVHRIIRAAKVARSTFYYHFLSKDELLLENLCPLIDAMAAAPFVREPTAEMIEWLEHIWQHRVRASGLLTGRTGTKLQAMLVQAMKERLSIERPDCDEAQSVMIAEQYGGGSMTLLQAWIGHRFSATPAMVARALPRFDGFPADQEGNTLEIEFEQAGTKRVLDSVA